MANRITNIDQLYIDAGVDRLAIPVGDMLVFVTESNRTARVSNNVNPTAKIKGKVEAGGSCHWHILAEIEKSSRTARERLKRLRPSKA